MPSQDEAEYHPAQMPNIQVRVALAPRAQPYDESIDSLNFAVSMAQQAGFRVCFEKIRKGCPGFQNAGPVITHMLRDGDTHLFLAADDVIYPPEAIVRLVRDDKDIVSGIYRKNDLRKIEPANKTDTVEEFLRRFKEGGVYEAEFAANHTMTIKRSVIEKMVNDYPELEYDDPFGEIHYGLFIPMIVDRKVYQDDWAFSIRAKNSGFRIWDDYGVKLKHYCADFLGFDSLENYGKP